MGQRQIATNNINEYSSRSHTIVSLQIDSEMVSTEKFEHFPNSYVLTYGCITVDSHYYEIG